MTLSTSQVKTNHLAEVLEAFRKESGLSFDKLAARAGMDVHTLHDMAKGESRGSRDYILRICLALPLMPDDADTLLVAAGHPPLASRKRKAIALPVALPN